MPTLAFPSSQDSLFGQAISPDQVHLRHNSQYRKAPVVDRHQHLRAGRHPEKELDIKASMYEILQVLSLTLFEKTELKILFSNI